MTNGEAALVGAAIGTVLGGAAMMIWQKSQAQSSSLPPPSAPTYDVTKAIHVSLGGSFTVPVGANVVVDLPPNVDLWRTGVVTSNATSLAPSYPATTNGFVAVAPGTATLTGTPGSPSDGQARSVQVTVVPQLRFP